MRIFISTGEVSGDLQGSLLVAALLRQAAAQGINLEILALGGQRMAEAGATLIEDTTSISSLGLIEALQFVVPTWQIQQRAKQYLREHPPDLLILIDYAGPNFSIGKYIRRHLPQVPIIYYIAPQAWVWAPPKHTTQQLLDVTDHLLAIFAEEARFFEKKGVSATWVGHPLLDYVSNAPSRDESRLKLGIEPDRMAIALLPASRQQELKYLLPTMCEAARQIQEKLPEAHFYIPVSLTKYRSTIEATVGNYNLQATILEGKTLEVIAASDLAIAKSGTVNLEIALLNVPQVVIYRVSKSTMWLARKIFNFSIAFMSPVNLVVMRQIVPELLQEQATPEQIVQESLELLLNAKRRQQVFTDYQEMREKLGEVGVCDRAAREILAFLEKYPIAGSSQDS
jgi:lipid-A-disaccharide synthase